jgi:hypothetical protein
MAFIPHALELENSSNGEIVYEGPWPINLLDAERLCKELLGMRGIEGESYLVEYIHSPAEHFIIDDDDYQRAMERGNSPLSIRYRESDVILDKVVSQIHDLVEPVLKELKSRNLQPDDLVEPVLKELKSHKLQPVDYITDRYLIAEMIAGMIVEQMQKDSHKTMTKEQWIDKGISDYNKYYNPDYEPSCHNTAIAPPCNNIIVAQEQDLSPAILPPSLDIDAKQEAYNRIMPRAKRGRFQQAYSCVQKNKKFKANMNDQAFFVTYHHMAETDKLGQKIEVQSKQIEVQSKQPEVQSKQIEVQSKQNEVQSKQLEVQSKQLEVQSKQLEAQRKQIAALYHSLCKES